MVDRLTHALARKDILIGQFQIGLTAMIYQKAASPYPFDGAALYINPRYGNSPSGTLTHLAAAEVSHDVYIISTPPPSTFDDGSVHLLGVRRSGAALEVRVDGAVSGATTTAQVAVTDVSAVGVNAIIGQNGYTPAAEYQQFHGDIAEMLAISGPSASTYLPNLEQYLKARYSMP